MPCRQIFSAKLANGSTATSTISPTLSYTWTTGTIVGVPWPTAGSFKNVSITHASAPGSGKSFTYTFVKNGADTALVVTIADLATTGSNTADAVAVVPGDVVYWKRTSSGTPALSVQQVAGEFWGDVANESAYGGVGAMSNSVTHRNTIFAQGLWNTDTIANGNFDLVAAAGNLTAVAVKFATAPGAGKSYALTLYKNAVKQDGTGGTVNTTITIADSATTGSWAGTLALAAGDYVTLESVPTGTPTAVGTAGIGVKFVATTDGESQGGLNAKAATLPTTAASYYACPHMYCQSTVYSWPSTEATVQTLIPPGDGVTISGLRVRLTNTVTTGPLTFTVRQNTADTAVTATLTSGQQTGSDLTNSVALAAGDAWSVEYTAGGTPGTTRYGNVAFIVNGLIVDACVFLTTTRTERAVLSDRAAIGTLVLPVDSVLSLGELPARTAGELVLSVDATGEVTAGALASADLPAGAVALHATTHKSGGTDVVKLDELAAPTDITTLNASTSAHGLLSKLPGTTTTYLRGDGTFVVPSAAAPAAHATSHQPGGADPMAVDAAAATGSLRTLGTSATSAAAGNDARFTDARTPSAHKTTHEAGGSDALSGTVRLTTLELGTTPAATGAVRLANAGTVMARNSANTADHQIVALYGDVVAVGSPTVGGIYIVIGDTLLLRSNAYGVQDLSGAGMYGLDGSQFYPFGTKSLGIVSQKWADAHIAGAVNTGTVVEQGRATALGHWQAITFNAANFTSDSGTWTVGSGAVLGNRYALVGKTMFWSIYVSWFSGSNTITGAPTTLFVQHPSVTFIGPTYGVIAYAYDGGAVTDLVAYPDGGGWIGFVKKNGAAFTAGTTTGFVSMMTWEIA